MDPNATLKVSPERLAELASVDPDVTPGPSAALRQIGSVRPGPSSERPPPSSRGSVPSQPGQSGAFVRASTRPPAPVKKGSAFATVILYVLVAVVLSAAVIGLIALAGLFLK
jgi:hypothetical protein